MKTTLAIVSLGLLAAVWLTGCSNDVAKSSVVVPPDENPTVLRVPSDYATIQAAIDDADAGDTILVAGGNYTGSGNRDLILTNSSLVFLSEDGPESTVLDLNGTAMEEHFGFMILGQSDGVIIDGFTIRDGYAAHGPAIVCQSASPTIRNCLFRGNHATTSGGAMRCKGASPIIQNCTFVDNSAAVGGAIQVLAGASPVLERCVLALADGGGAVYSNDGTSIPQLSCCIVHGNEGGDWVGRIEEQADENGNMELDPQFCEPLGDFHVRAGSPCLPTNNDCGLLIGALGMGCP